MELDVMDLTVEGLDFSTASIQFLLNEEALAEAALTSVSRLADSKLHQAVAEYLDLVRREKTSRMFARDDEPSFTVVSAISHEVLGEGFSAYGASRCAEGGPILMANEADNASMKILTGVKWLTKQPAKKPSRTAKKKAGENLPSTIRAWARENGHEVGNNGRLPSRVIAAYKQRA